jgi:hypothetical protein
VAINFCFNVGKTATETVETVRATNGDETLTGFNIFRWYERLREGREEVQNDPKSGRPSESRMEGNMERVLQVLLQNRHLLLRMTADESAICKDTVRKTVVEGLKKGKLLALCTGCIDCGTERYRLAACEDLIEKADSDPDFFFNVIGD